MGVVGAVRTVGAVGVFLLGRSCIRMFQLVATTPFLVAAVAGCFNVVTITLGSSWVRDLLSEWLNSKNGETCSDTNRKLPRGGVNRQ